MDTGSIAWGLTATALVLFMTPGVAFFYGGLVKAKSVVSMMMMSFGALGLITVLWILYGFNMSVVDGASQFAGNPFSDFGLGSLATGETGNLDLLGATYGATFAIITVALISGAVADRAKFGSWMIFAGVWATLVYFPVAAWVWGGGWIMSLGETLGLPGVIDYAGGTAVHINAGAAALALALVLGKRIGFQKGITKPHNVPLVLLGASILWFGWFGFNAGAEWLNGLANVGLIVVNTLGATAAAILGWLIVEKIKDGKATSVGAASGAVAGLVAITPACANLEPGWALLLGVVAGAVCAMAIEMKFTFGFDDSLDVVGIHLVGGLIGTLYLGFFAIGTGIFVGGDLGQLTVQAIAAFAVLIYSFVVAYLLGLAIEKTIGFRVKNEDEVAGIDTSVHGEEGYALANV
ncbi:MULTISPECIES: ammonium transporter [Cryobacterium]|uniref:Ammonium transporter n=1 Tax=Cryobacterium zongtaii TaxID=1259217 RepID=A0A2S3ZIS5_9MICO|nr:MULTISPECIES: ammonium transporter [Cryobacterium]POH65571.1 ammonia channel protein [Cryobacterium zongtaii]POH67489.1 ammonia channel protein [Cryobacterium zongtaii]TFC45272.1 ammonium transporter [Cryobacterium sp. TMN-39-2]